MMFMSDEGVHMLNVGVLVWCRMLNLSTQIGRRELVMRTSSFALFPVEKLLGSSPD